MASALLLAMVAIPAAAQNPVTVRSQSGQFVVRGLPQGPPASGYSTSAVSYLRIDPSLAAVSLDRIRMAIAAELGWQNQWAAQISVTSHPVREDNSRILITSVRYQDGWGYKIDLPEIVDKPRFLHAAVKVILLEFANRRAVLRESELPPWLVDGLAAELQATSLGPLALEPETAIAGVGVTADPLAGPREQLRQRAALNFTQLSLPGPEETDGTNAALFRACAHLFVHDLLRLRNGPDMLRDMLSRLPENLNWQTTFLRSFEAHFPRLIEIDKWYALSVSHLTGRDRTSVWTLPATFDHLDEMLATSVNVRLNRSELPMPAQVKLQRIIAEWDFEKQAPVLHQKLRQLDALHLRAAPELLEVIREYHQALDAYLRKRRRPGVEAADPKVRIVNNSKVSARDVVKRLDALDLRLDSLRLQHLSSDGPPAPARAVRP